MDRIIDASLTGTPAHWQTGHYLTDWTYAPSWAKRRRRGLPSADPDAGWISIKGHGYDVKWHLFGYKVVTMVRTRRKSQRLAVPYSDLAKAGKKQAGQTKRRQRTRAPDSTPATACPPGVFSSAMRTAFR